VEERDEESVPGGLWENSELNDVTNDAVSVTEELRVGRFVRDSLELTD